MMVDRSRKEPEIEKYEGSFLYGPAAWLTRGEHKIAKKKAKMYLCVTFLISDDICYIDRLNNLLSLILQY